MSSIPHVELSDTFNTQRTRINQLIDLMNTGGGVNPGDGLDVDPVTGELTIKIEGDGLSFDSQGNLVGNDAYPNLMTQVVLDPNGPSTVPTTITSTTITFPAFTVIFDKKVYYGKKIADFEVVNVPLTTMTVDSGVDGAVFVYVDDSGEIHQTMNNISPSNSSTQCLLGSYFRLNNEIQSGSWAYTPWNGATSKDSRFSDGILKGGLLSATASNHLSRNAISMVLEGVNTSSSLYNPNKKTYSEESTYSSKELWPGYNAAVLDSSILDTTHVYNMTDNQVEDVSSQDGYIVLTPGVVAPTGQDVYLMGMTESTSSTYSFSNCTYCEGDLSGLQGFRFASSGNLIVGLNESGYITTSTDGIHWTTQIRPTELTDVALANWDYIVWNGSEFIVYNRQLVSEGGSYISTSTDGINWTTATQDVNLYYNEMCFNSLNNNNIVCWDAITGNYKISTDGKTWPSANTGQIPRPSYPAATDRILGIASIGNLYISIVSTYNTSDRPVYCTTSTDGINWTTPSLISVWPSDKLFYGLYTYNNQFIIFGDHLIATSSDGTTWTASVQPELISYQFYPYLYYSNAVVVFKNKLRIYDGRFAPFYFLEYSKQYFDWKQPIQPSVLSSGYTWKGISSNSNTIVAISEEGYISTSTDGINWTAPTSPSGLSDVGGWTSIRYYDNMFILLSSNNYISTSTDGINWTAPSQAVGGYTSGTPVSTGRISGHGIVVSTTGRLYYGDNFYSIPFTTNSDINVGTKTVSSFESGVMVNPGDTMSGYRSLILFSNGGSTGVYNLNSGEGGADAPSSVLDTGNWTCMCKFGSYIMSISKKGWYSLFVGYGQNMYFSGAIQSINLGNHSWNSICAYKNKIIALGEDGYIATYEQVRPYNQIYPTMEEAISSIYGMQVELGNVASRVIWLGQSIVTKIGATNYMDPTQLKIVGEIPNVLGSYSGSSSGGAGSRVTGVTIKDEGVVIGNTEEKTNLNFQSGFTVLNTSDNEVAILNDATPATQEEVNTGTDDTKYITPETLKGQNYLATIDRLESILQQNLVTAWPITTDPNLWPHTIMISVDSNLVVPSTSPVFDGDHILTWEVVIKNTSSNQISITWPAAYQSFNNESLPESLSGNTSIFLMMRKYSNNYVLVSTQGRQSNLLF